MYCVIKSSFIIFLGFNTNDVNPKKIVMLLVILFVKKFYVRNVFKRVFLQKLIITKTLHMIIHEY